MSAKHHLSILMVFALAFLLPAGTATAQDDQTAEEGEEGVEIAPGYFPLQQIFDTGGYAYDNYGHAVVIEGSTALVGMPWFDRHIYEDQGAVDVYGLSGTTWTLQTRLTAPVPAPSDHFGYSIALSGDTAVIGSPGKAHVFVRSGTSWSYQGQLVAPGVMGKDLYGYSVAVSGDTALVSASRTDVSPNVYQGAAYVFTRSGTTWSYQGRLTAPDGGAYHFFGESVSLWGDTALVGSPGSIGGRQGTAYVFTRSGTTWTQQQVLIPSDGSSNNWFGASVALEGDTALVGAYYDNVGPAIDQGSAYVFTRSGTTWSQQARLTASDGGQYKAFGYSVALSGDIALVGAPWDGIGVMPGQGSAYAFARSGTAWSQQAKLTAPDGSGGDEFGRAVAISGENLLVGVPLDDIDMDVNQGSVHYFQRIELPPVPILVSPNGTLNGIAAPTFTWNVYPTATAYRLAVYSYGAVDYIVLKTVPASYCTSAQCYFPSPVNLKDGNYKWKVLAYTPWGTTPYSAWMSFSITGTSLPPPGIPIPISPNGTVTTHRPTFSWQASEHAAFYRLAVYHLDSAAYRITENVYPACTGGICTYTHASVDLLNGNYMFKVLARNATGTSEYSTWMAFTVLSNLPAAPTLIGPSGMVVANPPTYQWNTVVGATRYRLAVYSNTDGKYIILSTVYPSACSSGTCSTTPPTQLAAGAYRFKVLTVNTYGIGGYSAFMNFSVP